jgi:hypothetical protein
MSLRLDDYWIWDFWFAQDGPDTHVFFLHAPRALGDPELRHRAAQIRLDDISGFLPAVQVRRRRVEDALVRKHCP